MNAFCTLLRTLFAQNMERFLGRFAGHFGLLLCSGILFTMDIFIMVYSDVFLKSILNSQVPVEM